MLQPFAINGIVSSNLAFLGTNYSKAEDILIVYCSENSTTRKKAAETWYNSEQNCSRMGCKPIYLRVIPLSFPASSQTTATLMTMLNCLMTHQVVSTHHVKCPGGSHPCLMRMRLETCYSEFYNHTSGGSRISWWGVVGCATPDLWAIQFAKFVQGIVTHFWPVRVVQKIQLKLLFLWHNPVTSLLQ